MYQSFQSFLSWDNCNQSFTLITTITVLTKNFITFNIARKGNEWMRLTLSSMIQQFAIPLNSLPPNSLTFISISYLGPICTCIYWSQIILDNRYNQNMTTWFGEYETFNLILDRTVHYGRKNKISRLVETRVFYAKGR